MAGLAAVTVDPVSATGACMGAFVLSQHQFACMVLSGPPHMPVSL